MRYDLKMCLQDGIRAYPRSVGPPAIGSQLSYHSGHAPDIRSWV